MSKSNREKRANINFIEVELPPIDESLPWGLYKQKMMEDTQNVPLTVKHEGKTYSAVDCFLKRKQGPLAFWTAIYVDKPKLYDVNDRPEVIQAIINKNR